MSEIQTQAQLKRWSNPEERKRQSERMTIVMNRPEVRIKNINSHKGQKGQTSWIKGLTKETDERVAKMAKSIKITMNKPEMKRIISKAMIGKIPWNKNLTKETDERVAKQAKSIKITHNKSEIREKNRIATIKQWQDPNSIYNNLEYRTKMVKIQNRPDVIAKNRRGNRIAFEKRVENSGYPRNYFKPNFNFESIPIYKSLDKILHTRSRYGGTSAGEKKIGRYFVDYFNKKYKIVLEWNENWHYDNGQLKEYDIEKRKYILTKYPNYTYIIIKQSDWFNNGNMTEEITIKIVDYILTKLNIYF